MLFDGGQPRYLAVANRISADIASGRYAVGALLPSEAELGAIFSVSRHTVREALRRLQEVGLVSKRTGVGTVVEAASVQARYVQSLDAIEDFWQYVKDTKLRVTERGTVGSGPAAEGMPDGRPPVGADWLVFRGYRYLGPDSNRVCRLELVLNPRFAGIAPDVGVRTEPVYTQIERAYGVRVVELRQRISAVAMDRETAAVLRAEPGAPALATTRRYFSGDGELVEMTTNVHPADRFCYDQELHLELTAGGRGTRPRGS